MNVALSGVYIAHLELQTHAAVNRSKHLFTSVAASLLIGVSFPGLLLRLNESNLS